MLKKILGYFEYPRFFNYFVFAVYEVSLALNKIILSFCILHFTFCIKKQTPDRVIDRAFVLFIRAKSD